MPLVLGQMFAREEIDSQKNLKLVSLGGNPRRFINDVERRFGGI